MKLVILDIDGVIYRGKEPVEKAAESIQWLKDNGFMVKYLTNNATQVQQVFADRLKAAGVEANPYDIMTSSIATARYLKQKSPNGANVLVVGGDGLRLALIDAGFNVVEFDDSTKADYVTVGQDLNFTFQRLERAQHEIWVNKAEFIATNYDPIWPVENGGVRPGGGVIVRAIEACTLKKALIIGKPETTTLEMMLEEYNVKKQDAIMIGDNLDTDILAGKRAGVPTVFVLTGIHTKENLKNVDESGYPDYVIEDLSELKNCLS
jgi:4-nitrophenyl phosphatase